MSISRSSARTSGVVKVAGLVLLAACLAVTPYGASIAYGQTSGSSTTTTSVIHQVAVGSFDGGATTFSTKVQMINAGTNSVTVSASFFNQDGTASTIPFETTSSMLASFTGSFSSFSLPANDSLVISADGMGRTGAVNWGRIVTDRTVTIQAVFELDSAAGNLISRVGVPASDADLTRIVVPRMRNPDAGKGTSTSFALVNTGDTIATVTATLYSGAQAIGSAVLTLPAKNQQAKFAREFFSLSNEAAGLRFSHMVFESTTASIAATALVLKAVTRRPSRWAGSLYQNPSVPAPPRSIPRSSTSRWQAWAPRVQRLTQFRFPRDGVTAAPLNEMSWPWPTTVFGALTNFSMQLDPLLISEPIPFP